MPIKLSHLAIVALAGSGSFVTASRFGASGAGADVVEATRPAPVATAVAPAKEMTSKEGPHKGTTPIGRERIAAEGGGDAFRTATWTPPPPPPPPAAAPSPPPPPPPPTAPPLPFTFVGLLEQKASRPTAFLAKGEALVVAAVGDVIDGTYRVESLSAAGIVVTYLPLNQRQTLGPSGGTP
jgi:hypothetical protein